MIRVQTYISPIEGTSNRLFYITTNNFRVMDDGVINIDFLNSLINKDIHLEKLPSWSFSRFQGQKLVEIHLVLSEDKTEYIIDKMYTC